MEDLVFTASDDHVARLAHEGDPVRAIIELIWNAVDAEATNVVVTMERSSMDAINQVRVEDDGHGISSDEVALNDADRDTLTKLLSETTLSAIIRSANVVASRHKFLVALEHLLFDPDDSGKVGERDHLHKVLEHELWVFGESYHLMSTERSLTELLRNHLNLDGLPTKDIETVRRWDGKTGRTDLHLAAKNKEHDRIRHLVVELKAPGITASRKELDQVEDYANAILSTAAFTGDRTSWDLILVVTDYDDLVRRRIKGDDFEVGLFFDPQKEQGRPLVRAYVRRWRDVIDENKRRLEFMTNALEHDPSITEGLQYVRTEYEDLLPEELRATTESAN